MKNEYHINQYGSQRSYSVIVDYVFNPNNFSLELKCQSDIPSKKDIAEYVEKIHPLLFKKGIKKIEYNNVLQSNQIFNNYTIINIYF